MSRSGVWSWGVALALTLVLEASPSGAQPNWTKLSPPTSPPARYLAGMAYDTAGRGLLLFGGVQGNINYNDTWLWSGGTWTRKTPTTSPPARGLHAMAADTARGRVVLFGGIAGTTLLRDTWEWDGSNWARKTPTTSPPAGRYAIAFDPHRRRIVLVGGATLAPWEWDGVRWINVIPPVSPPVRSNHGLAYDATRRRVLLYGGSAGGPVQVCYNDTWEWDGVTWGQLKPAEKPHNSRPDAELTSYPVRRRILLHANGIWGTAWEWDGSTWTERRLPTAGHGRTGGSQAYDHANLDIIDFGGIGSGYSNETWQYGFAVSLTSAGTPRRGGTVTLNLTASGQAGLGYRLGTSFGPGPTPIGIRSIGLTADPLLGISTSGGWPAVFQGYRSVVGQSGTGSGTIRIPNLPILAGLPLHSAGVTLNPIYPQGIQSVTNTVTFKIQ